MYYVFRFVLPALSGASSSIIFILLLRNSGIPDGYRHIPI